MTTPNSLKKSAPWDIYQNKSDMEVHEHFPVTEHRKVEVEVDVWLIGHQVHIVFLDFISGQGSVESLMASV